MKILLLLLGVAFMVGGIYLFKTKKDIINTPKESATHSGSSSLFDQIVNDDFKNEE